MHVYKLHSHVIWVNMSLWLLSLETCHLKRVNWIYTDRRSLPGLKCASGFLDEAIMFFRAVKKCCVLGLFVKWMLMAFLCPKAI